jgi:hypothetical protein
MIMSRLLGKGEIRIVTKWKEWKVRNVFLVQRPQFVRQAAIQDRFSGDADRSPVFFRYQYSMVDPEIDGRDRYIKVYCTLINPQ